MLLIYSKDALFHLFGKKGGNILVAKAVQKTLVH